MDALFNILDEVKPIELTKDEFIAKAKKIFEWLDLEHQQHFYKRKLTDDDYKYTPCEGCKGCGEYSKDDVGISCVADYEEGECYENSFDAEEFTASIEQEILFGKNNIYTLLNANII